MPAFDAGSTVEELDWDFTTLNGYPDGTAKGTIKEPSDKMIGRFLDGLRNLMLGSDLGAAAKIGEDANAEEILSALNDLTGDALVEVMDKSAGLYAALCSGHPTKKQLTDLPLRVRVIFYEWLMSEVVRPEARTPAGNGQVVRLPTAARG